VVQLCAGLALLFGGHIMSFVFQEALVTWRQVLCANQKVRCCCLLGFCKEISPLGLSGVSPWVASVCFFHSVVATWLVSAVFGQLSRGHVRVIVWCCLRAGRSTTPLGSSA